MHNYTSITKLFSRYFKKYIIQCRKFRENPAKCEILALEVIQNLDQVMLCTGAAKSEDLIFIMYIKYMGKISDILKLLFGQKKSFDGDRFADFCHVCTDRRNNRYFPALSAHQKRLHSEARSQSVP